MASFVTLPTRVLSYGELLCVMIVKNWDFTAFNKDKLRGQSFFQNEFFN
jgi:hypothetical protein